MITGIVADNYKIEKFKKELTAKGFTDFKLFPFTDGTTTIQLVIENHQVNDIKRICQMVELFFKQSN